MLFLDWRAGPASKVVKDVRERWKSTVKAKSIQETYSTIVRDISADAGKWRLVTDPEADAIREELNDVVVLAVGFGLEHKLGSSPRAVGY